MYLPFFLMLLLGLPLNICGTIHNRPRRMVRGELAPAIYPYQISLQVYFIYAWINFCGGSIITKRHVITAAHCLELFNAHGLSIWAGSTKLNGDGQRYIIQKSLIHPDYINDKKHNPRTSDIGIITIRGSFVFSENIRPIDYSAEEIAGGIWGVSTGWGSTNNPEIGGFPNELRRIEQITITHDKCSDIWIGSIDNTTICAESKLEKGFCSGDSGSPFAKDNQLIGVVSFGPEECGLGKPDVYTRISTFYQWIKNNTN